MNYYKPNKRSEPDEKFHKYANTELITAIKDFQRDNNLPVTGRISSGDETERVINEKLNHMAQNLNIRSTQTKIKSQCLMARNLHCMKMTNQLCPGMQYRAPRGIKAQNINM